MSFLFDLDSRVVILLIGGVVAHQLAESIFRFAQNLIWDPLPQFKGPRLARFTAWYKTYYEVFKGVSWTHHLEELHKQYGELSRGSVVRVGPNELHFSDPAAYHAIYNNNNRWDKEATTYQALVADHSSVAFLKYADAKERKEIMQPLFSRRSICDMQEFIQSKVDRLCEVLTANNSTNQSSNLFLGLRSFALDAITSFCFATSANALSVPDFQSPIILAMEASHESNPLFKHFPHLRILITNLPTHLSAILSPRTSGLAHLQKMLATQVNSVLASPAKLNSAPHRTIYHELLNPPPNRGHSVKNKRDLIDEAQALTFGGVDTVGNTLMLGIHHLLDNPPMAQRLKSELLSIWPDLHSPPPRFESLEKLPYLTAVIKESLRIGPGGVPIGLPRIVPPPGATICNHSVPAQTIVSIAPGFVHQAPEIFPSPETFRPERWLAEGEGAQSSALDKWLVSFSRGPRMCLGQNLAWCELYMVFAALFRRFDMQLDMGGAKAVDVKWHSYFLPLFLGEHLKVFCKPAEA
ncbi:Cytochrome P450 protein [Rutstroemia sp. NJR-2017a WRK4]|nr:Cytochrome P450 protein [Rutstroemia sp. NJR-2017a WRK4]